MHATVFELTARIGERRLKGWAKARDQARAAYEDAMERGKAAVLHEELLKGVHMLSVGQIGSGDEVEATAVWRLPTSAWGGRARLRIPLTVGDVYGRSSLPDSDALIHGGEARTGWLTVRCAEAAVTLNGASVEDGEIEIPLDRPIDLAHALKPPRPIMGRAADGRGVELRIAPHESEDRPLDCVLLLDHSGSTGERFSLDRQVTTKHQAAGAFGGGGPLDFMEAEAPTMGARSLARASFRSERPRSSKRARPAPSGGEAFAGDASIDWTVRPDLLRKGDLSALPPEAVRRVCELAAAPALRALAKKLGLDPIALALALLARSQVKDAAAAAKFAKLMRAQADPADLDQVSGTLGL